MAFLYARPFIFAHVYISCTIKYTLPDFSYDRVFKRL